MMQKLTRALILCIFLSACHNAQTKNATSVANEAAALNEGTDLTNAQDKTPNATIESSAPAALKVKLNASGHVQPDTSNPVLKDVDLTVDPKLDFPNKMKRYIDIYDELIQLDAQAQANKKAAKDAHDVNGQLNAQNYIDAAEAALLPYSVAQDQATIAIGEGYKLNGLSGNICKVAGDCEPINPQAAMFFFLASNKQALGPALASAQTGPDSSGDQLPSGDNGDLYIEKFNVSEAVRILSSKPLDTLTGGLLPRIRDSVLPKDHNGELTRAWLDPIHYPDDVIQNWAKHAGVVNNTGVQIAINPVRCLSHLFHRHSKKC